MSGAGEWGRERGGCCGHAEYEGLRAQACGTAKRAMCSGGEVLGWRGVTV